MAEAPKDKCIVNPAKCVRFFSVAQYRGSRIIWLFMESPNGPSYAGKPSDTFANHQGCHIILDALYQQMKKGLSQWFMLVRISGCHCRQKKEPRKKPDVEGRFRERARTMRIVMLARVQDMSCRFSENYACPRFRVPNSVIWPQSQIRLEFYSLTLVIR